MPSGSVSCLDSLDDHRGSFRPAFSSVILVSTETYQLQAYSMSARDKNSSVVIAAGCGQDGWGIGGLYPIGKGNCTFLHNIQTDSGAHTTSYLMDALGCFPGGKAAMTSIRPLTFTSLHAEMKNIWAVTPRSQSQLSRGLRHELSSLARTLVSWVRIPLKSWLFVYAFIPCLCCPLCR
jgi:hypothetical protein